MFRKGPQAWREGCGGRPGPPGSPTVGRGRLDLRVAAFSEPVACRRACCVACGAGQRCRVAAPVLASRAGRVDAERAWEGSRAPDCGAGWHHTPRDARRLAYGGVQLDQRLTSQQIDFLIWLLQRVLGYQLGIEIFLSFLF